MDKKVFIIILVTSLSILVAAPKNFSRTIHLFGREYTFSISSPRINISRPFVFRRDLTLKRGLDIQGGTEVILEADMSSIAPEDRDVALESTREVLSRRVDLYGVSEPVIQTIKTDTSYRVGVALPGLENPEEILELIGQTAKLDFREIDPATDSASLEDFIQTDLTGSDLKKATVEFDPQTGVPMVGIEFSAQGAAKFAGLTERNVGKPVAIFLDSLPISAPVVQEKIEGGQAVISGEFTLQEAKNLAITLNAGALPVPITIIGQKNIAPTLGEESVAKSLRAGIIGLIMVALFMILLYGKLGIIADICLIIYGLITLAVYKLIPVTISLPGLAGFILSIGMAVDANILIFERMKEERRKGHDLVSAMEIGFGRAWDSIKDANIATLITTFILFNPLDWNFLNTSGPVRGFALTLFLGIVLSLFTGVFVTRTMIRVFYSGEKS